MVLKNKILSCNSLLFAFQVFRKYSHSLGPDELEYLEDILKNHDISDDDVEMSIELIAKEYNKQDGSVVGLSSPCPN
jgi:DNA polymerase epsilon subunit 2